MNNSYLADELGDFELDDRVGVDAPLEQESVQILPAHSEHGQVLFLQILQGTSETTGAPAKTSIKLDQFYTGKIKLVAMTVFKVTNLTCEKIPSNV